MLRRIDVIWCRALCLLLAGSCLLAMVHHLNAAPKRKYNRVKPDSTKEKSSDAFFRDLFNDGLQGPRPANLGSGATGAAPPSESGGIPNNGGEGTPAGSGKGWNKIVSAQTLEDEIKSLKLEVDKDVTTPTAFKGLGHKRCRKNFSVLAMMFAIIGEYDGEVRWKDSAPVARDLFSQSAVNCKTSTTAAYNGAKLRKDDLGNLIRGSALSAAKESPAQADWSAVVERSQLMKRLEASQKKLRELTANKGEFEGNSDVVVHEAEMMALMAEAMLQDGMPEADDEDYAEYCKTIKNSALEILNSVKLKNLDGATGALGPINRSCDDCHEIYRG